MNYTPMTTKQYTLIALGIMWLQLRAVRRVAIHSACLVVGADRLGVTARW